MNGSGDAFTSLVEDFEDEIARRGYDPETLHPTLWLMTRQTLALAAACKENDGSVRGVYCAITNMHFYVATLLTGARPSWLEHEHIGAVKATALVRKRRACRDRAATETVGVA